MFGHENWRETGVRRRLIGGTEAWGHPGTEQAWSREGMESATGEHGGDGLKSDHGKLGDLDFTQETEAIPISFIFQNDTQLLSISCFILSKQKLKVRFLSFYPLLARSQVGKWPQTFQLRVLREGGV